MESYFIWLLFILLFFTIIHVGKLSNRIEDLEKKIEHNNKYKKEFYKDFVELRNKVEKNLDK